MRWTLCVCLLILSACSSSDEKANEQERLSKAQEDYGEEVAFLKAFKEASGILLESYEHNKEMDSCAFGEEYTGNEENLELRRCREGCYRFKSGSSKYWNCMGTCWEKVGGQRTPEGRAECYKQYVEKLRPYIEKAENRARDLDGCNRDVFLAFVVAAKKALDVRLEPSVSHFPIETNPRGDTFDVMAICTKKYFDCGGLHFPCHPLKLARVLGSDPEIKDNSTRVFTKDGKEVNTHTLQIR